MMPHGRLPFQLKIGNSHTAMTSFAGLPFYLDLSLATGLCAKIADALQTKSRGWTDLQIVISLILLNLAGGDCVDDIERLESDEGMRTLLLKLETHGMKRKARRIHEKRWRKSKERAFPSAAAIHRYLEQFHDADEEIHRVEGKAFIPASNALLESLTEINSTLVEFMQEKSPSKTATLDQDATLSETHKKSALYCYKKFKAYQPFNTYWHEQDLLVHSEFRDGNVNAGFEQLRLLKASLDLMPASVDRVLLRSDSAGYQQDLLRYCAEGKNARFGIIEFAISATVTGAFKAAALEVADQDWQPIYKQDRRGRQIKTTQEWAEVCFVPNFVAAGKATAVYRYIAIRERMAKQLEIEGLEPVQQSLPFQTLAMNHTDYKLFGLVTNRTLPGNELINWHRERCGDAEKVHSVEKTDLSGGQFPSKRFGANAAWWQIMLLAFNLQALMKRLVFPESLKTKRLKAVRFHFIGVAGRFVQHARGLYLSLSGGKAVFDRFTIVRQNILALAQAPP
jgi:Transposase DDE domain group 1